MVTNLVISASSDIGFEYVNIRNTEEVKWIRKWVEEDWYNQNLKKSKQESILKKLNEAVVFENFLHTKFINIYEHFFCLIMN